MPLKHLPTNLLILFIVNFKHGYINVNNSKCNEYNVMAFFLNLTTKYGYLLRFFSSSQIRNPYDVLGLKSNSSSKDIKKAYIKLCKELHPDKKPGDESLHKKFIELNDAYTRLISSEKRQNWGNTYDDVNRSRKSHQTANTSHSGWTSEKTWYETEEYQEFINRRDKKYTVDKNFRIANLWVVTGCLILMIVGLALYLSAYSYAHKYTNVKVDEKSKQISEKYDDVRKNALEKGRAEQLTKLQKKWYD